MQVLPDTVHIPQLASGLDPDQCDREQGTGKLFGPFLLLAKMQLGRHIGIYEGQASLQYDEQFRQRKAGIAGIIRILKKKKCLFEVGISGCSSVIHYLDDYLCIGPGRD